MAKAKSDAVKPLVSRGYGKIVLLTLVAIGLGCLLMGYELFVDYGGQLAATKSQAKKVPSSLPPPEKTAPAPGGPAPAPGPNGNP